MGYLILGLEILMAITGLIAIITNRFPYRPGRPVTGLGAYVGGAIMILPLAVALPVGMAIGRNEPLADAIGKILVLHIGAILFCFIGSYVIAALLADVSGGSRVRREVKPRRRRERRRDDDDDDDDDRPRRRRRRAEGGGPPPLPRRRDDDDDDDEESPARRRPEDGAYSRSRDDEPRSRRDDDGSFRRR
ncbi:MAG: hypothetical protein U0793_17885 [Gemmataceae bacterium]